jgi:hypothetical protein
LYRSLGYVPSRRVCQQGFLELIAGRIYADPDRLAEMFCDGWPLGYDPAALRSNPRLIDRSPTCFAPERTDAWLFRCGDLRTMCGRAADESEASGGGTIRPATLPAPAYVERERASLRQLADRDYRC